MLFENRPILRYFSKIGIFKKHYLQISKTDFYKYGGFLTLRYGSKSGWKDLFQNLLELEI